MGWGIGWILAVSDWVAALGGSVRMVPAGPSLTLVLLALGACFALLWRGRLRAMGALPVLFGFALWATQPRPDLLIAEDGRLMGLLVADARVLSAGKGNGFSAENWLANDGDAADQITAFARDGFDFDADGVRSGSNAAISIYFERNISSVPKAICETTAIVIAAKVQPRPEGKCLFFGSAQLSRFGATAIWVQDDGTLRWAGARTFGGNRPWTGPALPDSQ